MKKLMILLATCCLTLTGCGNQGVSQEEYDRVVADKESLEKELSEIESEQSPKTETNVIFNEKYMVDGEEISIILGETGKEISLTMYGHAKDREKSYLMFATFLAECKNIEKLLGSYSVVVNFEELNITYMTTDSGYVIMGTNADGSTVLEKPDWIPTELSELAMEENEIEEYILELDSKIADFGETSGYRMGILVENGKGNNGNNLQSQKPEIGENEGTVIYSDENVIIKYAGVDGKDSEYKIKFSIENLSDKTLTIQLRESSINGIMARVICSIDVAPGKKAIDGGTVWGEDAKTNPMSSVKNFETKFHIFDDERSVNYDTENVIVLNEE